MSRVQVRMQAFVLHGTWRLRLRCEDASWFESRHRSNKQVLQTVVRTCHTTVTDCCVRRPGNNALLLASAGCYSTVQLLLERKANVNHTNKYMFINTPCIFNHANNYMCYLHWEMTLYSAVQDGTRCFMLPWVAVKALFACLSRQKPTSIKRPWGTLCLFFADASSSLFLVTRIR
jgi:hypothetical protein